MGGDKVDELEWDFSRKLSKEDARYRAVVLNIGYTFAVFKDFVFQREPLPIPMGAA
jgi:hypothetical protein